MADIPKTKNDCFTLLDKMLSEEDKKEIAKRDSCEYHFSLGMWIRNNWIYNRMKKI